jgi:hypothetical protein
MSRRPHLRSSIKGQYKYIQERMGHNACMVQPATLICMLADLYALTETGLSAWCV